jgi:hypothetical protein
LPFESAGGLVWLRVEVPQSTGPLNFLLDSGASASVINLPTAKELGLKLGQRVDTGCTSALQWVVSQRKSEGGNCGELSVALTELNISSTRTRVKLGSALFQAVPTGLHRESIFTGECGLVARRGRRLKSAACAPKSMESERPPENPEPLRKLMHEWKMPPEQGSAISHGSSVRFFCRTTTCQRNDFV